MARILTTQTGSLPRPDALIVSNRGRRAGEVAPEPLSYTGHGAIASDIAHLKAGLLQSGLATGFMTSIAPGSCSRIGVAYYESDEGFLYACADAMRETFTRLRIEALNHALSGFPPERVRFHLCWGSWHGPHTTDIGFERIVDLILCISAGAYLFEAGNELVADRIERFARRVGAENVMAGTDCGLGGRVHAQIAWAKLEALVQGAALASERLS